MENTKQVEAYLRKFMVEEAVQAAVNSAILHKAQDPILHVADFLEARGQEHEHKMVADKAVPEGGLPADNSIPHGREARTHANVLNEAESLPS